MRDAPAFDFYPERWIAGTRHMTKTERCDYLELLLIQWLEDGIIDDLPRIARRLGYRSGDRVSAAVLEKFPVGEDGRRRNVRLEQERDKQRRMREKRSEGAKKTNSKRWETPRENLRDVSQENLSVASTPLKAGNETHSLSTGVASLSDRSASSERHLSESPPTTLHQLSSLRSDNTPIPPEGAGDGDGDSVVDEIYQAYPRKASKPEALRAIRKALRKTSKDKLLAGIARWIPYWKTRDPQFTPMPATFFNQERWNDEPPAYTPEIAPASLFALRRPDPEPASWRTEWERIRPGTCPATWDGARQYLNWLREKSEIVDREMKEIEAA